MKKAITIFLLIAVFDAYSQISVNPLLLYIDPNARNATMDVINVTNEPREFIIELKFAYYDYNSEGIAFLNYNDSTFEQEYSLIPYLKMFPKKLIIPPNQTQTVRFMVRNLPEDANKTYWTRFIAYSEPLTPQIDTSTKEAEPGKIRPKIVFKTQMNGQIVFNKGNVSTNVDIKFERTEEDSNNLYLWFDMEKSGVSPCIGYSDLKIYDSNDRILNEQSNKFSLYKNSKVKFGVMKDTLKRGKLRGELTITSERPGIDKEIQIPMLPSKLTFYFVY